MSKCIGFCHEQSKLEEQTESALHIVLYLFFYNLLLPFIPC